MQITRLSTKTGTEKPAAERVAKQYALTPTPHTKVTNFPLKVYAADKSFEKNAEPLALQYVRNGAIAVRWKDDQENSRI